MFNKWIENNYQDLLEFTTERTKDYQEPDDILHYVIDYFIQNYDKKKLNNLIKSGKMEYYIKTSLSNNCFSKSAPYYQKMIKPIIRNTRYQEFDFEYYTDGIDEDFEEKEIRINKELSIDYTFALVKSLIQTDYVKKMFYNIEHWAYTSRIFLMVIEDGDTLAEISKRTGISHQTIGYNYRKIIRIIKSILKDKEIIKVVLPSTEIYNIYNSTKIKDFDMEFAELLEIWKSKLPNVLHFKLIKAVSQRIKKNNDRSFERDKESIAIELMYHMAMTKNLPPSRVKAQERINLVHEYLGKPTAYNKPGCASCMDKISNYARNFINEQRKNIIKK